MVGLELSSHAIVCDSRQVTVFLTGNRVVPDKPSFIPNDLAMRSVYRAIDVTTRSVVKTRTAIAHKVRVVNLLVASVDSPG